MTFNRARRKARRMFHEYFGKRIILIMRNIKTGNHIVVPKDKINLIEWIELYQIVTEYE